MTLPTVVVVVGGWVVVVVVGLYNCCHKSNDKTNASAVNMLYLLRATY